MWNDHYKSGTLIAWIDLTTTCNAKCPQCHRTNPDGLGKMDWLPNFFWSLEEFKQAYTPKTMRHLREFEFCGTWGEPVSNPWFYEIVEYVIKNSDCNILLNTNGSLRSEDWWFKLGFLTKRRLRVMFAVDGSTQEMHEMYRRNTNLDKVLRNMEAFSSYGEARTFCVTFKHNEDHMEEIKRLSESHGSSRIVFMPSNRFHSSNTFDYSYKGRTYTIEEPSCEDHHYNQKEVSLAARSNRK